jgi:predicted nucleic acid-binding protein
MVAAVCSWHEHHEQTVREIERRFNNGEGMVVAAPTLIEAYSVLTRLPPPHRISPAEAFILLEANFFEAKTATLDANAYHNLLRGSPEAGISGGRVYDAVIAACARSAKVRTLLTFNEAHFASMGDLKLEIVVPRR